MILETWHSPCAAPVQEHEIKGFLNCEFSCQLIVFHLLVGHMEPCHLSQIHNNFLGQKHTSTTSGRDMCSLERLVAAAFLSVFTGNLERLGQLECWEEALRNTWHILWNKLHWRFTRWSRRYRVKKGIPTMFSSRFRLLLNVFRWRCKWDPLVVTTKPLC